MSRVFHSTSLQRITVGIGIALCGLTFYFGVEVVTGQFAAVMNGTAEEHIAIHWRITSFTVPLLAFLVTAQVYHCRWTSENLDALRSLLRPGAIPPSARPSGAAGWSGSSSSCRSSS